MDRNCFGVADPCHIIPKAITARPLVCYRAADMATGLATWPTINLDISRGQTSLGSSSVNMFCSLFCSVTAEYHFPEEIGGFGQIPARIRGVNLIYDLDFGIKRS